jgi:hypothetical protein
LARSRTKTNTHLLIKIALLTWDVYDANRDSAFNALKKKKNRIINYRLCGGTSHNALESLAIRDKLHFAQLAAKGLIIKKQPIQLAITFMKRDSNC